MDANEQTVIWTQAYLQWLDGDTDARAEQGEQDLLRLLEVERGASEAAFAAVAAELHALAGKVMALRSGAF